LSANSFSQDLVRRIFQIGTPISNATDTRLANLARKVLLSPDKSSFWARRGRDVVELTHGKIGPSSVVVFSEGESSDFRGVDGDGDGGGDDGVFVVSSPLDDSVEGKGDGEEASKRVIVDQVWALG